MASLASHTDEIIAIGTAALAVVTLTLVLATGFLVRATRKAAGEAREDSQALLRASDRPLLIEVLRGSPVTADMDADADGSISLLFPGRERERIDSRAVYVRFAEGLVYVSLPLRNVGRGLAIIDVAGVELSGSALRDMIIFEPVASASRVPPGETTRINLMKVYDKDAEIKGEWSVSVPYRDFAGGQATTAEITLACPDGPLNTWLITGVAQVTASA
jgi:hypothetical protein